MKFLIVLVAVATQLLLANAELRELRCNKFKLYTIHEYVKKSIEVIQKLQTGDLGEAQNAADDFTEDINLPVILLTKAVTDNTRDNEAGKALHQLLRNIEDAKTWAVSALQSGPNSLQENLKLAVEKYKQFVDECEAASIKLDQSAQNVELAKNIFMDTLDQSLFLLKKLDYHLEFRQFTNSELQKNIVEVLEPTLEELDKIKETGTNELVVHAGQLDFLLSNLIKRLEDWLKVVKIGKEIRDPVEKSAKELREISEEIQTEVKSKPTLDNLKVLYKKWLNAISKSIGDLDLSPAGQDGLVRKALFDIVGIVMNYKSVFANLLNAIGR